MVSLIERRRPAPTGCFRWRGSAPQPRAALTDAELAHALASTRTSRATSSSARGSARATTSTSTASRRGPTSSRPLGERIAAAVAEHAPDATRLAGPELGAVALAAAASLASGPPVPDRAEGGEGLRDGQPDRRAFEEGESRVPRRGRRHVGRRAARLGRRAARGRARRARRRSAWSTARKAAPTPSLGSGVALRPIFRAARVLGERENSRKTAWLSRVRPAC